MLPERTSPLARGWDGGSSYQRYLTVPPAAGSSSRRPSLLDSIPGSPQSRRASVAGSVTSQLSRRNSLRRPSLLDSIPGSPDRYVRRRSSLRVPVSAARRSSLGPGGRSRRRSLTPVERWRLQAIQRSQLQPRRYHMSCDLWSSDEESVFEPVGPPSAYSDDIRRMSRSVDLSGLDLLDKDGAGGLDMPPIVVEPPQVSLLGLGR